MRLKVSHERNMTLAAALGLYCICGWILEVERPDTGGWQPSQ